MKKPNFEKWAKREIKQIREDKDNFDRFNAYRRTAKVARGLGDRYAKTGEIDKAERQYSIAAQSYIEIGEKDLSERMYRKIESLDEQRRHYDGILETSLASVFIIVGFLLLGASMTGRVIQNSFLGRSNFSFVFFILGLVAIYVAIRKR